MGSDDEAEVLRTRNDAAVRQLMAGDVESGIAGLEAIVDESAGRVGEARVVTAQALINLAQALAGLQRPDAAATRFERYVAEHATDQDPEARERLALALQCLTVLYGGVLERPEDADVARDRLARDFSAEERAAVAEALTPVDD